MSQAKDGKEGHPDLWYSKYRLRASLVKQIGKSAKLDVTDTAQEMSGRMYIGNINHQQALRLNLLLGGRTTNTGIEAEVFRMLLSGKAFDGNGRNVDKRELDSILDEKVGVRNPGRAEWYEDSFEEKEGNVVLMKNYILQSGILVPSYNAQLQDCLMKTKNPGIDLKNWAINPNAQGWPRADIRKGATYYWSPTAGHVAWLFADSVGANLVGNRNPQDAYSWLGLRHLREAPKK